MIEPPDLEATPSDEYELDPPVVQPAQPAAPVPLPRMWKTDESEPEIGSKPDKKEGGEKPGASPSRKQSSPSPSPSRKAGAPEPSAREAKRPAQASKSSDKSDDPDKKKALVEETPEWDTYEARRRARLFLGGGMLSFVLLAGYIGYRLFIYNPDADELTEETGLAPASAPPAPNLDLEARAMIDRAKEHEKGGRRKESVALLEKVIKVYPNVSAAKLAQDALERARQDQPMFPDPPPVVAALPKDMGVPPDGIPPTPAKGGTADSPPADFNQTRPPDPVKGLAIRTPAPTKPDVPAMPKTVPSVDTPKEVPVVSPPKPRMNPLPRGFHARVAEGIHESGWPLLIESDIDESRLVFIPEGTFVMGANGGPAAEAPAHRVRLRAFYIDQHEVTIGQFNRFLDKTGYRRLLPSKWAPGDGKTRQESKSLPVTMVNFKDAEAFAEWSLRQLPTEAQWEMAARASASNLYPWGSDPITWEKPRGFRQIDPVRSFSQDVSAFGVFDLAGNAAEWTQDWFDLKYFQQFAESVAVDPLGPAKGSRQLQRVVKGGAKSWSVSYREGLSQEKRVGYVGFRCVLNLSPVVVAPAPKEAGSPDRPNLTPVVPF